MLSSEAFIIANLFSPSKRIFIIFSLYTIIYCCFFVFFHLSVSVCTKELRWTTCKIQILSQKCREYFNGQVRRTFNILTHSLLF